MTWTPTRLVLVGIVLLLAASALPLIDGSASAAEHSFVVEQGTQCYEVSTLRGNEDVASFYDYRNIENRDGASQYTYSSYMPSYLTQEDGSRLFLYEGPDGVSLVMVHNARSEYRDEGTAVTFQFAGLPSNGYWAVQDDNYAGQDDQFSRNRIDWSFYGDRTDGAAFTGLDRGDTEVTIYPAFDESAALYDSPVDRTGRTESWQFLTGSLSSPNPIELDRDSSVTIRTGYCGGDERPPTADLSAGNGVAGFPVTFDARGSADDRGIVAYRWDFDGDGNIERRTAEPTVQYTYSGADTYDATVTVVDEGDNTDTASVGVAVEADDPPSATFDVGDRTTAGLPVTFDARGATDDVGIAEYRWDFDGDGEPERQTATPTVTRTFEESGEYNVTLTVIDGGGNTATANQTVSVAPDEPPEASFSRLSEGTPIEGEQIVFSARNSTDDTGIVEYRWTLSESATDTGERAAITYPENGTYEVTLEVIDEGGNNATATREVEILPPDETPPNATVSANRTTVEADVPVGLDARDSEDDRAITAYQWELGDGTTASGPTVSHSYSSAGTYNASVTVTDDGDNTDEANVTVEVRPASPPNVSVVVPDTVLVNQSFEVEGTATDESGVAVTRWEFAGVTKTGDSATHTFEETETYNVTFTAVDSGGHANTVTRAVEVLPPDETPPDPELRVSDNETKTGDDIRFDASNSTDDRTIAEYRWDFDGDGAFERRTTNATVTNSYDSPGTYNATVVVADGGNNTENATVSVVVEQDRQPHSGGGGGGGSSGVGGSSNLGPPPVQTSIEEQGPNRGVVDVRSARADETVEADLPEMVADDESGVRFEEIAVDIGSDNPHFVVEASRASEDLPVGWSSAAGSSAAGSSAGNSSASNSSAAESLPIDVTVGSLSVETKYIENRTVEQVAYDVRIQQSRLKETNIAPEDVQAYQRDEDAWEQVNTTVIEGGETVIIRVRTDEFASITLGGDRPVTVTGADIRDSEVVSDESVAATATLRNPGDDAEKVEVNLSADDEVVATETFEVPSDETRAVTVETALEPGEYEIAIAGVNAGTVTVTEAVSDIEVGEVVVNESTVAVGEQVEVVATVENTGTAAGERTVALRLFGEAVATQTVAVPSGEVAQVRFVRAVETPGNYSAMVGNHSATLDVRESQEQDRTTVTTTTTGQSDSGVPIPGFGIGAAVLALAAAVVAVLVVVLTRR